jgi:hypothetical protein
VPAGPGAAGHSAEKLNKAGNLGKETPMPALLTIILASILASSQIALADQVPEFNVDPGCHAAAMAVAPADRHEDACKRSEREARGKLEQEWGQFTPAQRSRCVTLSTLGGSPSYVELLTCLEIDKAAKNLPPNDTLKTTGQSNVENDGKAGRSISR